MTSGCRLSARGPQGACGVVVQLDEAGQQQCVLLPLEEQLGAQSEGGVGGEERDVRDAVAYRPAEHVPVGLGWSDFQAE